MVIDRLTIWEAAAHPSALKVMLIGVVIVLPFIVAYTVFAYRMFRGKAKAGLYEKIRDRPYSFDKIGSVPIFPAGVFLSFTLAQSSASRGRACAR